MSRPQLRKLKLNQQVASLRLVTPRIIFLAFVVSEDAVPINLIQCLTTLCLCALTAYLRWTKFIRPLSNGAAVAPVTPLQMPTSSFRTYQVVLHKNVCVLIYVGSDLYKRFLKDHGYSHIAVQHCLRSPRSINRYLTSHMKPASLAG